MKSQSTFITSAGVMKKLIPRNYKKKIIYVRFRKHFEFDAMRIQGMYRSFEKFTSAKPNILQ